MLKINLEKYILNIWIIIIISSAVLFFTLLIGFYDSTIDFKKSFKNSFIITLFQTLVSLIVVYYLKNKGLLK
jgi:hypothetical protein